MPAVFRKIFVNGFYRANAGVFLFVLLFMFGMLRMNEHLLIAAFFLSSPVFLLIPLGISILYGFNVYFYYFRTFRQKENSFLSYSILMNRNHQARSAFGIQLFNFMPVLFYGCFLLSVAVFNGLINRIFPVVAGVIIFQLVNWFFCLVLLNRPYHSLSSRLLIRIPFHFGKSRIHYIFQFIAYAINADAIKLILSKFLSVVLITSAFYLYRSGDYKISIITLAVLFAVTFNGLLVFGMHDFYENQYRVTRNLPYSALNRFYVHSLILLILMFPELSAIMRNAGGIGFIKSLQVMAYCLGMVILIKSFLLVKAIDPEIFIKYAGYLFIGMTFLLLYRPPLILLAVVPLFISALLYKVFYYRYEPVIHSSESLP